MTLANNSAAKTRQIRVIKVIPPKDTRPELSAPVRIVTITETAEVISACCYVRVCVMRLGRRGTSFLTLVAVSTDRSAGAPHQTKQQATGARAGMNCRQRRKHVRTTR
jgi:hypothetical protein